MRSDITVAITLLCVALFFLFIGLGMGMDYIRRDIVKKCEYENGFNINGEYYKCE